MGRMDFDAILNHIGQCGKWQWRNFFLLWLTSAAGGLAVVVWSFTGIKIPHRCAVPYCNDDAFAAEWADSSAPKEWNGAEKGDCQYLGVEDGAPPSCDRYQSMLDSNSTQLGYLQCENDQLLLDTTVTAETSLVNDFGLTCSYGYLRNIVGATYMLGMLVGSFALGYVSDKYGRMKALMLGIVLVSVPGFIGAFMKTAGGFGFFRFLTGMGGIGTFMVTFVLAVEFVGPRYTTFIGIAIEIPFALGEMLLGLEAYYIRDWRTLQMVAYLPLLALVVLWFLVPESPRWLIASDRPEEATEIIKRAAKINGKSVPDHLLAPSDGVGQKDGKESQQRKVTVVDLFRPTLIMKRSFNMFYQWFSVTLCYYGLSFASTSLAGDAYSNYMLSVFVEIPGYIFCLMAMDCWGRRPILSFCQLISGLSCIAAGLLFPLTDNPGIGGLQVFLSLIGKFMASACFAIVYVYTAELFPTMIRNTAIGSCSTIARVGGICALLVSLLAQFWKPLPMVVMGSVAVAAGALAVFFPETVGEQLPDTMEDAINIGKNSSRRLTTCIWPKNAKQMFFGGGQS